MLAPQLKKKVDALWNKFWTAGIANPLVAVEQITYLLFLKRLEALDNERVSKGKPSIYAGNEQCKWSYIKQDRTPQHLLNKVFPWLRELEKTFAASNGLTNGIEAIGQRMSDAYFQLDPNKGVILGEAIELIDSLFERVDTLGATTDIMGDTFLVFQKETRKDDRDTWKTVDAPRTQSVWFYEVKDEAFSLDAKRTERPGQNNDL